MHSEFGKNNSALNINTKTVNAGTADQYIAWDVSNVTDMSSMFYNDRESKNYHYNHPMQDWNTSKVTDMSNMFKQADFFNQDISLWDVSNVTDMSSMFYEAYDFNQNINDWNTTNVTNMSYMFYYAYDFGKDNPELNINTKTVNAGTADQYVAWDVSNVTDMSYMFYKATEFNQNINDWDTSNVTLMDFIFDIYKYYDKTFDTYFELDTNNETIRLKQDHGLNIEYNNLIEVIELDTETKVVYFIPKDSIELKNNLFSLSSFNINGNPATIKTIVTSNVTDMKELFNNKQDFNEDIGTWDVSNVTDMSYMFNQANIFNQDISFWDTSNVTDMSYMFYKANSFNQQYIENWDTSNVTLMDFISRYI